MILWMLVCGITWTVTQRTIIETGEWFGWMAACAFINVCLFGGVMSLFGLQILNDKIMAPNRKYRYSGPM